MDNLFDKAMVFTDLHFGYKGNSHTHNKDCSDFIDWAISEAETQGCDTCIFTGDWHNTRSNINIATLNYSIEALGKLSKAFKRVFFIPGNHDIYYKDRRDIHSLKWASQYENVEIMNDFYTEGNVTFTPWLVGEDHKELKKITSTYIFGHFELPYFLMNAAVRMPDTGELQQEDLANVQHVFSGHFHKRQTQQNITYIGNAFPHNYGDAWDDERGITILEFGGDITHKSWPDAPKYRVFKMSDLEEDPDKYLSPNTYARCTIDIEMTYEESIFLKEEMINQYDLRELVFIPSKEDITEHEFEGDISFETVDEIVVKQLTNIDSEQYDKDQLLSIYLKLGQS